MKKKVARKRILAFVLAICTLAVLTACGNSSEVSGQPSGQAASGAEASSGQPAEQPAEQAPEQPSGELKAIKIGFPSAGSEWPGGILGVAKEFGYLEEYLNPLGYTASLNPFTGAAPAIHEALVGNQLDYVVYAGMAGVLGKASGIDTTLISVSGFSSLWQLVVTPQSGIKTIADLKGKKIAYQRGASPHMYVIRVLKEAGYSIDEVESVIASIPDTISGLATGLIDAGVMTTGQEVPLVANGASVVHVGFNADKNVYYEPSVFIARTAIHKENPEIAVAIQKALLKAWDKVNEDVEAYFKLQADRSGYPLDVVLATADRDIVNSIPLNLDDKYVNSLKDIETFLLDNKIIAQGFDFDKWLDRSVTEKAAKEYADEKK